MQRRILLCLVLITAALFGSGPALAQSILPLSFAAWTANGKEPFTSTAASAQTSPDPAMAVAREYGYASGERATFFQGAEKLEVALYRMKDASGAYGEYSYLRTTEMPRADFTEHSAMSRDRALVLTGNLVLDIRGNDWAKARPELAALVEAVSRRAEQGLYP